MNTNSTTTEVNAELHIPNPNDGVDVVIVTDPQTGDEIARVRVTATEDAAAYDAALAAAGFTNITWT